MRRYLLAIVIAASGLTAKPQAFQIEQLALDIQKLAQLKNILSDLYKGYMILSDGYAAIRDISEGNFSLHKAFLDGLLLVSPAVRDYSRITDIINCQSELVSEYRSAFRLFSRDRHFTPGELLYLGQVYGNLFRRSLDDISNLINILTAGSLRMSDDERLRAIDEIYSGSKDKLIFLRRFSSGTQILAIQRSVEDNDAETLKNLYGIGSPHE